MNAHQRRKQRRHGLRFIAHVVNVLRPLADKIEADPKGAAADFREIIKGYDREFGRVRHSG